MASRKKSLISYTICLPSRVFVPRSGWLETLRRAWRVIYISDLDMACFCWPSLLGGEAGKGYLRLAIWTVKLSIYICNVWFSDTSLSTSFCTVSTRPSITNGKAEQSTLWMNSDEGLRTTQIVLAREYFPMKEENCDSIRVSFESADWTNLITFSFIIASRTISPVCGETAPHAAGSPSE